MAHYLLTPKTSEKGSFSRSESFTTGVILVMDGSGGDTVGSRLGGVHVDGTIPWFNN